MVSHSSHTNLANELLILVIRVAINSFMVENFVTYEKVLIK